MCLVATIVGSTGIEHFHPHRKFDWSYNAYKIWSLLPFLSHLLLLLRLASLLQPQCSPFNPPAPVVLTHSKSQSYLPAYFSLCLAHRHLAHSLASCNSFLICNLSHALVATLVKFAVPVSYLSVAYCPPYFIFLHRCGHHLTYIPFAHLFVYCLYISQR